jgi:hypothetical protein
MNGWSPTPPAGCRDGARARGLAWALVLAAAAAACGCTPRFEWREIRVVEDGFTVALPDHPLQARRDVDLGDGLHASMHMTSTGVGATLFAVGVATLPPAVCAAAADCQAVLARVAAALARNLGGGLTAQSPAAITVPPGRQLRAGWSAQASGNVVGAGAAARAARLAVRLYVVDDRLYQVVAIGTPGELEAEALETFFTSFRILAP